MSRIALFSLTAALAIVYLPAAPPLTQAELKPRTLQAFDAYMRSAEARLHRQAQEGPLWADGSAERRKQILQGKALADPWTAKGDTDIPDGLIHDWVGAVFIPGVKLDKVLRTVQDYDNHKNFFKPEVMQSKLLSQTGDEFKIYLRLLKKKVLTVVLNTNHDVRYHRVDGGRWYSTSYSTRIAEVDNAGQSDERELPAGKDHGFLWRLNSFWRFQERDGGVYVECEAISLTRDVPNGVGWLINPIVRSLPRESLVNTLEATRKAVLGVPPRPQ